MSSEAEKWVRLYHKVNQMMLSITIGGYVRIDEQEPSEVMEALLEIDGGEWNTGLDADGFNALITAKQPPQIGEVEVREFVHPDGVGQKAWDVYVLSLATGKYAESGQTYWKRGDYGLEPFARKEDAEAFAAQVTEAL